MPQKKITSEDFFERMKKNFGDRLDFSKTVFNGANENVTYVCPKHGEFTTRAHNVIYGHGCPKCAREKVTEVNRSYTGEFIDKARKIHGNKYDYSKVDYVNHKTKVCIVCPKHGDFWQTPICHLSGQGCIKCAGKEQKTTEQFIKEAKEVHGCKYEYSRCNYVNSKTKVIVTCPKHGDFLITPSIHLQGQGCPDCKRFKARKPVCGIGINDYEGKVKENGKRIKCYEIWRDMLKRCYVDYDKPKSQSYRDCVVDDRWLRFSNFVEFFDNPENGYIDGHNIDKDLLSRILPIEERRKYSPENCCFLPPLINNVISLQKSHRGKYPIGVSKDKGGKFSANVNNPIEKRQEFLGLFDTPELAFEAYKKRKKDIITCLAKYYYEKGELTDKAYNALLNFEITKDD